MHIDIRGHLKATDAIRQHIERRLTSAVGRFGDRIQDVTVRLEDVNGPGRGGADKACHITLQLEGSKRTPVRVEEVHADLYLAITQAADRLSQVVAREVDRMHHNRSKSPEMAS